MRTRYRFDAHKAVEVLLYIAERCQDVYVALKVLYFADKKHLSEYGRFICGDSYVAILYGPVPDGAYSLVKLARGDAFCWPDIPIDDAFSATRSTISPHRRAVRDLLSQSDIECLDWAIEKYGRMTFGQLKKISHEDPAFLAADRNGYMALEDIVGTLPNADLVKAYLEDD